MLFDIAGACEARSDASSGAVECFTAVAAASAVPVISADAFTALSNLLNIASRLSCSVPVHTRPMRLLSPLAGRHQQDIRRVFAM